MVHRGAGRRRRYRAPAKGVYRGGVLRRAAADALETGRWDGPIGRGLARAWAAIASRSIVRPGVVPRGIAVVCVGGATLGGSGKTRVAVACARSLANAGARVALVGHAYRSTCRRARVVAADEDARSLEEVGDEALVCARALADVDAFVVVGPTRQSALDHAARLTPDVVVIDGPLRLSRPGSRRVSILAVDSVRPWGTGRLPPAGDLRAPRDALVACADHVVPVDARPSAVWWSTPGEAPRRAPLASIREGRLGLFTAIARPHRLVEALRAEGARLEEIVSVSDHGPVTARARARLSSAAVDAWLATEKCALHLGGLPLGRRLGILEAGVTLPSSVEEALRALLPRASSADRAARSTLQTGA